MLNLLNQNNTGPQANKTPTAAVVLQASKKEADNKSTLKNITVTPKITQRSAAQDEANHRNIINQALIGAKEGVVEALTTFVGTNIIDTILWRTNGN